MRGMTFAQKALARAAGKEHVEIGEIVNANVDVAMMDDILGPRIEIAQGLEELGVGVWDKSKVVVYKRPLHPAVRDKAGGGREVHEGLVFGQGRGAITNTRARATRCWQRPVTTSPARLLWAQTRTRACPARSARSARASALRRCWASWPRAKFG